MSNAVVHPTPAASPLPSDTSSQTSEAESQQEAKEEGTAKAKSSGSTMPSTDFLRRQMAHCGEYTFQALNKVGKLSPEDTGRISQQYLKHLSQTEQGKPFQDAIQFLVFEGWKKKEVEARDVVLGLTRALLRYSKTKISHIAFAHQTETPIEFYNNYPAISEISRILQCPIIQISEKDFVMIGSINPFTAMAAARLVSNEIEVEVGRKPFQFVATTDLNAWKYSCERHFGT